MSIDSLGFAIGFGALALVFSAGICLIFCLRRVFLLEKRSGILMIPIYIGIIGSWFSVSLSFLLVWLLNIKMPHLLITYLWAWGPALQLLGWIYLGLHLWDFRYKKQIFTFFVIFNTIYLFLMYFFPLENTEAINLGGVPDTVAVDIGFVLVLILVLFSMVLIPPLFLWVSYHAKTKKNKLRGRLIAFSCVIIGIFQFLSATSFEDPFLVIFLRGITALMLFTLYWGFTMPNWLLRIFKVSE